MVRRIIGFIACILLNISAMDAMAATVKNKDKYFAEFGKFIHRNCDVKLSRCFGNVMKVVSLDEGTLVDEPNAELFKIYQKESVDLVVGSYNKYSTDKVEFITSALIKNDRISTPLGIKIGMKRDELVRLLGMPDNGSRDDLYIYVTQNPSQDEVYGLGGLRFKIKNGVVSSILWEAMYSC